MKKIVYLILILMLFASCMALKQKKSEDYYFKNEAAINEILQLFKGLNKTQPLSLGFSSRSFKSIGVEINTDTVRYVINNDQSLNLFYLGLETFKYDTIALRKIYQKMYDIKALWIGKSHYYYEGRQQELTFLSFRSVMFGNPFLDRRYYALIFLDYKNIDPEKENAIAAAGYKKVKGNIYYTIADNFR
jgi:hypothetical protein